MVRERVQLFHTRDRRPFVAALHRLGEQVVVHLAAAEYQGAGGRATLVNGIVVEHGLERPAGEIGQRRSRFLAAKQRLRGHHHEWALHRPLRLTAQQVEVLCWRRAVGDADVAFGRRLQESLDATAGVLGAAALVSVRQQQGQPRRDAPLAEPRRDELIEHDLGPVHEVAVLRFPEHERVTGRHGVTVLEPDARQFRQRRIVYFERGGGLRQRLDRREGLAVVDVVQYHVAMREGAATRILSGESHRCVLRQERRQREGFGVAPVDPTGDGERGAAPLQLGVHLGVHRERRRPHQQLFVEGGQLFGGNSGFQHTGRDRFRRRGGHGFLGCVRRPEGGLDLQQMGVSPGDQRVGFACRDHASLFQRRGVLLSQCRMHLDLGRHDRLREARFVAFVVSVTAVADQVDQHVAAELQAVRHRQPDRRQARWCVVRVDVDDRDVEALRQV